MSRRRYQRGSLRQEEDRWIARWREDVLLPDGEVKRVHKKQVLGTTADLPTKRLAMRELERRLVPINGVDYRPAPAMTFADFSDKWKETVMVQHKRSTQSSERSHLKTVLIPAFGKVRLRDLSPEMAQKWVSESTAAPKTTRNLVVTLRSVWATAKDWGYVSHDPFRRLALPAAAPGRTYHFTVEEALAIIDKAQGRWKVFFRILAETGMRPGELAGLRRDAIGDSTLTIKQSVWGQQVQTPKSKAGIRTMAISASQTEELRAMIDSTPENGYGLVWVTPPGRKRGSGGRPLSMDNFRNRVLNPILEELGIDKKLEGLGIERCGFYPMRHMNLTLMDSLNVPMKTRQKRAGHAQIETTLKHYTHAIDSDDVAVADTIGALFSPKGEHAPDSPEAVPPGILAHPAVQAEIARQVALALGRQPAPIIEAPVSPLLVLSGGTQRAEK
jgi:integrase